MPSSLRIAVVALAVVVVAQLAVTAWTGLAGLPSWWQGLLAAAAMGLLLTGLLRHWRVAFMWGRVLGYVLPAIVAAEAAIAWRAGTPGPALAIPLLANALPLLVMAVALGRDDVPAWFRLACPNCGGTRARAADLGFRTARCQACGTVF